jgi:hypothetical protein
MKRLVSIQDRFVRVWDVKTGKQVKEMGPTLDDLYGLAVSRDGNAEREKKRKEEKTSSFRLLFSSSPFLSASSPATIIITATSAHSAPCRPTQRIKPPYPQPTPTTGGGATYSTTGCSTMTGEARYTVRTGPGRKAVSCSAWMTSVFTP